MLGSKTVEKRTGPDEKSYSWRSGDEIPVHVDELVVAANASDDSELASARARREPDHPLPVKSAGAIADSVHDALARQSGVSEMRNGCPTSQRLPAEPR